MKRLSLIGKKFSRLKVISDAGNDKCYKSLWLCQCDCGNEVVVRGGHLKSEFIKSCGCLHKEKSSQNGKNNKGKRCSEETKQKMSEITKGFKHSEETKRRISEANKSKNNGNYKHGLSQTKEYGTQHSMKRKAWKLNQTPILTELENEKILMCYRIRGYLGVDWNVDHIIPLSKGGSHRPNNLQITTKKYNLKKNDSLNFRTPTALEYFEI